MVKFLMVLSLHYACDALATQRPLSLTPEQLGRCLAYYDHVKAHFADDRTLPPPGTPETEAARRAAFVAFKAWERANKALVAAMRAQARAAALTTGKTNL